MLCNVLLQMPLGLLHNVKGTLDAYIAWKCKNGIAQITLLSTMQNDLLCEFEEYEIAYSLQIALKDKFCATAITKLMWLMIKFDTYKKLSKTTIRLYLREIKNLIKELKTVGHILSDEQQGQAVIRSLPHLEHMKVNLSHNASIITFNDVSHHLELQDECLEVVKSSRDVFVAKSCQTRPSDS